MVVVSDLAKKRNGSVDLHTPIHHHPPPSPYFAIAVKVWRRRTPGRTSSAKRSVKRIKEKRAKDVHCYCPGLCVLLVSDASYSDVFKACGIPRWLQTTGFLLGYANSAINCCVYQRIFSQEYRQGLKQSLKSLLPRCFRFTTQTDGHERQADTPL